MFASIACSVAQRKRTMVSPIPNQSTSVGARRRKQQAADQPVRNGVRLRSKPKKRKDRVLPEERRVKGARVARNHSRSQQGVGARVMGAESRPSANNTRSSFGDGTRVTTLTDANQRSELTLRRWGIK